MVEPYRPQVTM